jgi:zinc metalloprotease ZmpB
LKEIFDSKLRAKLSIGENEKVRDIIHFDEHWRSKKQDPLDVAVDYLRNITTKTFKISTDLLENVNETVSFDDPREQNIRYRLYKQKQLFDSTTVSFYQTYQNLPVWGAGMSVTVEKNPSVKLGQKEISADEQRPYNVIHAVNTSQEGIDVKPPSSKTIKHYKELFHTDSKLKSKGKLKSKNKRKLSARHKKSESVNFIRSLIRRDKSLVKGVKDDTYPIQGRFFVYKYDQDNRLPKIESNSEDLQPFETIPTLPLNPVSDKIKDGKYYVVEELAFSYTTKEQGAINWIALVELETKSVLYLRALVASVNGQVFKQDPITISGNLVHTPNQEDIILNPYRVSEVLENLNAPAGGTQNLNGSRVTIVDIKTPPIAPPTNPIAVDFNYNPRTDDFSAVNAYYHTERFLQLVESLGFSLSSYFPATIFPMEVDHRGLGNVVNAHCVGNGAFGIDHCCYALADSSNVVNPIGIAADWRVVLHEVAGHGILYEAVNGPNFMFSHSAGDSFAVILSDPESQLTGSDRFYIFPWYHNIPGLARRCDRDVSTWAWGGSNDNGGYDSEQILATTHFRIYRSIGGDSTDVNRKRFASRMMAYLMLRTIGDITPVNNPNGPRDYCEQLMATDLLNWTTEGIFGGAYNKVIRWSFEKQGEYQAAGAPTPVTTPGNPPPVDVYIEDGRHGEYEFQPLHWDNPSIWNRRSADGAVGHQEPVTGTQNFIYCKIKNRGTQIANNVQVHGYHSKRGGGLLLPIDIQSLSTAQIAVGTLAGNSSEEKIIGPFEWIPEINAYGYDAVIMIVSATDDASNINNFSMGETIPSWRLVPNDNNIGQRNMFPVQGISQIKLTVTTGEKDINQNDRVYLGIGGREFRCRKDGDSDANPFHLKHQTVSLVFGVDSNVEDPTINDPRNPFIDTTDISEFPVYLRTEPNTGTWEITNAKVETTPFTSIFSIKYPGIVLDDDSGEKVELD